MSTDGERANAFLLGVNFGGATGLALVTAVYTLLAPTPDIRARIPFLLASGGGVVELFLLLLFCGSGVIALLCVRRLSLRAAGGVLATSVAYLGILSSGAVSKVLPTFDTSAQKFVAMSAGLGLAIAALWINRAKSALRDGTG